MKFLDLHAQYLTIKREIDSAIAGVIERSDFIMGEQVAQLEEEIAKYCGARFAVSLNSGTDALYVALKALGIGSGDEVIVPSFTYIATAETVALLGATPVFCDIREDTFNINWESAEKVVTRKTKAIIPVHLYGQPADMDEILAFAKKSNLFVVEDAAQAIGATYKDKKVCAIGDVGCLSFFPTKNLGAYGDGGMIVTNNETVAKYAKMWRIHGQSKKYYTDFIGDSSRLDTLQAAILLAKLKHLDGWANARRSKALLYDRLLGTSQIAQPFVAPERTHVYHQYTIRVETQRNELAAFLKRKGIPTMVYYPLPLHQQKAFSNLRSRTTFPISESASECVLSLPLYPELPDSSLQEVAQAIISFKNET